MEHINRNKTPLTQERLRELVFEEIMSLLEEGKKDFVESHILSRPIHEYATELSRRYAGLPCEPSPSVPVSPAPGKCRVLSPLEKAEIHQQQCQLWEQVYLERKKFADSMRSDSRQIVLPANCAVRSARPILDDKPGVFPGEAWENKRVNPGFILGPLSQFKASLAKSPVTEVDAPGTTETRSDAVEPVDGGSKTNDDVMEVEGGEETTTSS
ncbi:hypothetical protein F4813DRAFT_377687 [Daldinia decipiens]|uniref:uncharacterized protein n=1 Tax=Daldinia decipiens TaxID=326647 RepID=UPI0020C2BF8E|nr:uncharacterized protein F4813DRAFT_377687 [Daldinia decipiens]KAI1652519.1 hypothetical protein F4813DRAFT_377687 [Daldinia decipiens]